MTVHRVNDNIRFLWCHMFKHLKTDYQIKFTPEIKRLFDILPLIVGFGQKRRLRMDAVHTTDIFQARVFHIIQYNPGPAANTKTAPRAIFFQHKLKGGMSRKKFFQCQPSLKARSICDA